MQAARFLKGMLGLESRGGVQSALIALAEAASSNPRTYIQKHCRKLHRTRDLFLCALHERGRRRPALYSSTRCRHVAA